MSAKLVYQAPTVERVGSFESLTQGGTVGAKFDGNFIDGSPVPFDPSGKPLVFS